MQSNSSYNRESKTVSSLALSQFGLAFSVNVVMSFMPFYIIRISTYSEHETMLWTGLIMGLNSFVAATASPLWGSLIAQVRPKVLYQVPFFCNAFVFLFMGFTSNLPTLLGLRLIQGTLMGASTIGIYMLSEISSRERLAGRLSLFQNAVTAGQLLAPPVGAYLVAHLGYRSPFVVSFVLLGLSLLLCHIYVPEMDKKDRMDRKQEAPLGRGVLWGFALILIATIQLTFLPSILPQIVGGFGLAEERALKAAGFIMMGYTATAIAGSYVISRLTRGRKLTGIIATVCLIAALFQVLLILAHGLISFTVIRMLQTGAVAAVIPLVMASLASGLGGAGIGLLNSARFAGNGVGPLMATTVLAGSNLLVLYLLIAGLTAGAVAGFWLTHWKEKPAAN